MPVGEHVLQGQVPFARKDKQRWKPGTCRICDDLDPVDLLSLNLLIADPKRWPRETFEGLQLPSGILRPRYRLWGAARVAEEWLVQNGYWGEGKIKSRIALRTHINRHVQWSADDIATIAAQAQLAEADQRALIKPPAELTPANFRTFFENGIAIGVDAQNMLVQKLNDMRERGIPIPDDLALRLMDHGAKLATAAANMAIKGVELDRDRVAELEGFRAGSAPIPVRPSKHHTIRVIDGEARPVVDEGRSDRRDYNERAREEGGVELPA